MALTNSVIETSSGDLLRAGYEDFINSVGYDSGTESFRTDLPAELQGLTRGARGNANKLRWNGSAWVEVTNTDQNFDNDAILRGDISVLFDTITQGNVVLKAQSDGTLAAFQMYEQVVAQSGTITNSSTTPAAALTLTTPADLDDGTYIISISFKWSYGATNNRQIFQIVADSVNQGHDFGHEPTDTANVYTEFVEIELTFTGGDGESIDIEFTHANESGVQENEIFDACITMKTKL